MSNKTPPPKPAKWKQKTAIVNTKVSRSSCREHSWDSSSSSPPFIVRFVGRHKSLKYPSPFRIKTMFAHPKITPEKKTISINPHRVIRLFFQALLLDPINKRDSAIHWRSKFTDGTVPNDRYTIESTLWVLRPLSDTNQSITLRNLDNTRENFHRSQHLQEPWHVKFKCCCLTTKT